MSIENYASYLTSEASSYHSRFHEFRNQCDNRGSVHVFFEGPDDVKFYMHEVRKRSKGRETYSYRCKGKKNLLKLRGEILASKYTQKNKCLFLIDKDFDDYLGVLVKKHKSTYITETYSIENYLVCNESLEVILADFCGISKSDARFKRVVDKFQSLYERFGAEFISYSALTLHARMNGKDTNFNNVEFKDIFQIDFDAPLLQKRSKSLEEYKKQIGIKSHKASFSDLKKIIKKLKEDPQKKWLRGKYEFQFFEAFIKAALDEESLSFKSSGALSQGLLLEVLSSRISLPFSLIDFFEKSLKG